jgi:tetratricopeptide (TPR) repeat protein
VGRSELRVAAALVIAVALTYLNAFGGTFQFDDYNVIVDNPAVHSWTAWRASLPGIRPLLKLSYTLNWTCGLGLLGFHLLNVAVHAANAVLVFFIAQRWTQAFAPPGTPILAVAATAAGLFALHPAQTEAVTYICGRSVSLMALFYLGALAMHLRRQDALGAARWVSPGLFIAALATKETAWTLPLALTLWQVAAGAPARVALRTARLHWLALGTATIAMLLTSGYRRLLDVSLTTRTLKENLLTQIEGVYYLLTQPLLGLRTNIDPALPVQTSLSAPLVLEGLLLVGWLLVSLLLLRRKPWIGLAGLWFFLHLAPTNSILPRLDMANDRQLYLAAIGPALLFALAIWQLRWRSVPVALACAIALLLGTATILRNRDFSSEVTLWQATVRAAPHNARAWNNLGFAHRLEGDAPAAREAFEHALALDPDYRKARMNLEMLEPAGAAKPQ